MVDNQYMENYPGETSPQLAGGGAETLGAAAHTAVGQSDTTGQSPTAGPTLRAHTPAYPAHLDINDPNLPPLLHAGGPPPPADAWADDPLGPGFMARTLPLGADNEGPLCATLVRYQPAQDPAALPGTPAHPSFALLYIHGWNDYFFQTELARQVAAQGGAFYAIDLRKYGRSYRSGQTFGYVSTMAEYGDDIAAAWAQIAADGALDLPLFMLGHSTGGLIAALWAHHNPGKLSGLILNSPWLETTAKPWHRRLLYPVIAALAKLAPLRQLPLGSLDLYSRCLRGWDPADGPLPAHLREFADDPAVKGWEYERRWKTDATAPVRFGWIRAVMNGQNLVARGLNITCPILTMMSTSSPKTLRWSVKLRHQDCILDVGNMAKQAIKLGKDNTFLRFPGIHDLFLSEPQVRRQVYAKMRKWIGLHSQ